MFSYNILVKKVVKNMDFNDYCKSVKFENKQPENTGVQTQNSTSKQMDEQTLKQTLSKYKGLSQTDLLNELLKETNKQKQNGSLDNNKISELGEQLKPLLDSNQQAKLNEILKMLR